MGALVLNLILDYPILNFSINLSIFFFCSFFLFGDGALGFAPLQNVEITFSYNTSFQP